MSTIRRNVPLKNYSNFKIGGTAAYFLEIKNVQNLLSGLKEWKEISKNSDKNRTLILGDGTNILFGSKGFSGLVIHNKVNNIEILNSDKVAVGAGVLVSDLLTFCIENSLSGFEWAGGLPGTVGGAVRGNAGAFGGETKDILLETESFDIETFEIKKRKNRECEFNYRGSLFKTGGGKDEIILSAVFRLKKDKSKDIKGKIEEKITYRKNRHPLEYPNVGSIFKNIPLEIVPEEVIKEFKSSIKNDPFPVLPTAKLIAFSDLPGRRVGDAQVSEKHPNFIINLGNAKADDVLELIKIVKKTIKEKFGVELEEEITII
ncbi:MAG: UDP-N-acetylmuramate dehydrogenase [Candidatus Levybacteria bacterium]|nr:UDP-N-acetylmuramate dehydrogenase [Candidatus Levybacteria bacterium]